MTPPINRRTFLKQTSIAGLAVPLILSRKTLAATPSGTLQHAAIGVAGQGNHDLQHIVSSGKVQVYALCDIDEMNLRKASQRYPDARLYTDWREMLEKEEGNIDSVNILLRGSAEDVRRNAIEKIQMAGFSGLVICKRLIVQWIWRSSSFWLKNGFPKRSFYQNRSKMHERSLIKLLIQAVIYSLLLHLQAHLK